MTDPMTEGAETGTKTPRMDRLAADDTLRSVTPVWALGREIETDLTEALKVAGEAEKRIRNLINASVSVAKRLDDDDECKCGMCEEIMFARKSLAALERIRNNKH